MFSTYLERPFAFGERLRIDPRAGAFNALNHVNFSGYIGTYGNRATSAAGFGSPGVGIANQLPARSMQLSIRVAF